MYPVQTILLYTIPAWNNNTDLSISEGLQFGEEDKQVIHFNFQHVISELLSKYRLYPTCTMARKE